MKHFYFLLAAILFAINIQAQQAPFITTWEVFSGSLSVTIPTTGTGYNYTVDFGDGTVQSNVTGSTSHTYNQGGVYTISITGDFPRIYFYQSNQEGKIISVDQWGDIAWTSMERAFQNCVNMVVNATDTPDLSQVTSMTRMFRNCTSFNQSINHWNVSNVQFMDDVFAFASSFNQPLNNWNVANATTMRDMFRHATAFNQPLDNWNVSNVTDMFQMFLDATSFNQPLNTWNVSSVTNMQGMFSIPTYSTAPFDQPLNSWDVSNVTNMWYMFMKATSYNQPLDNWNVSNVTDMRGMFFNASVFNQDISDWNFNNNVNIGSSGNNDFLANCEMDIENYDALLLRFANLGLTNKTLNANGLEYCASGVRNYLINNLGWAISGDALSTDCNFITGTILYDQDNNGCTPSDIGLNGFVVKATDGTTDWLTYSSNGNYSLGIFGTNFTVSVVNHPSYFTVTPASVPVTFTTSSTEIVDFCITASQTIEDLNITLLPTGQARPGFEADYRLVVRNVGTETLANVEATLAFDDLMQQFVSANPAPGSTTANSLTFPIGSMQPFQTVEIDITMLTFQPPTVEGGDILNFTAEVTPVANDHTPTDNIYDLAQMVVNSYDPNDKQVLQGAEVHIDDVDEYLDYLIRFQNTGTASAINVRILDTLHPKLDWSTLTPISASHDYYVNITEGNRVEFMFDNINLPDEATNEPDSHGFVAYKIKPKSDVQVGDIITGDASIYFDFNAPIITNMVQTEIVDQLGITDISNPLNQVVLYPNPTNKTLNIHITDGIELQEVLVYDLQGKKVETFEGDKKTLDVEHLRPGLYFLKITTDRGVVNRKLVKD